MDAGVHYPGEVRHISQTMTAVLRQHLLLRVYEAACTEKASEKASMTKFDTCRSVHTVRKNLRLERFQRMLTPALAAARCPFCNKSLLRSKPRAVHPLSAAATTQRASPHPRSSTTSCGPSSTLSNTLPPQAGSVAGFQEHIHKHLFLACKGVLSTE